jgi:hypothetical protein
MNEAVLVWWIMSSSARSVRSWSAGGCMHVLRTYCMVHHARMHDA